MGSSTTEHDGLPAAIRRLRGRLRMVPAGVEVLAWLAFAEIGVRTVPLPDLCSRMGMRVSWGPAEAGSPASEGAGLSLRPSELRRLRALDRLIDRWPSPGGSCLRQALVAGRILRRHAPELHLGVALERDELQAHAWLTAGGRSLGRSDGFAALTTQGV